MIRTIKKTITGKETFDGAGVKLKRIFGFYDTELTDPFLLLDFFGSDNPKDYINGFPWHPHRGIETVTYMLEGKVEHGDSLGNKGVIKSGDIQWMTAGSGIIHQEMPKSETKRMYGFQLWVNLAGKNKMIKPRYQDITANLVPEVKIDNSTIKILAGELNGVCGPVKDITINPSYFDIKMKENSTLNLKVNEKETVFAYIYEGECSFNPENYDPISGSLVLMKSGDEVNIVTKQKSAEFIFVKGMPIKESVAWRGPIVMNTEEELDQAFYEYQNGTFIK